ncbi:MAG: protein kinase [Deltaproteobacteria bacterium]|jgi:serine/threonine protein kinase|nr:protein kinase [Deltaproteobacteria bacterium]
MAKKIRSDSLPIGFEIHGYKILDVIGSGAFGITYLAKHIILDSEHVIKEFFPTDSAVRTGKTEVEPRTGPEDDNFTWGLNSFFEEAKLLHSLSHINVVKVTDVFKSNGTAYFVMPFLHGCTFHEWIKNHQHPTKDELLDILVPLLEGLHFIHEKGILHRDIKPENIYIQDDGDPILIDFGAARMALGHKSRTITKVLTPHFAPFEQYDSQGTYTPALDIYSLAACIYQAITHNLPPEAPARVRHDNMEKLVDNPTYVTIYGHSFLSAIDKALSVFPEARFQNCKDFQDAILTEDEAGLAPTVGTSIPPAGETTPPSSQPGSEVPDSYWQGRPTDPNVVTTDKSMPQGIQVVHAPPSIEQNAAVEQPISAASIHLHQPASLSPQKKSKAKLFLFILIPLVIIGGALAWFFTMQAPTRSSSSGEVVDSSSITAVPLSNNWNGCYQSSDENEFVTFVDGDKIVPVNFRFCLENNFINISIIEKSESGQPVDTCTSEAQIDVDDNSTLVLNQPRGGPVCKESPETTYDPITVSCTVSNNPSKDCSVHLEGDTDPINLQFFSVSST